MDLGASNWNEDDNANTTAAPDGAPEGMAPSGVNNVLRAHQGALKRFYSWTIPKITGGSGTAYTLSYAVAPGSLVDGMTHLVQFHAVNGASATLNVNTLGATPLHYYAAGAWRAAPPALFDADTIFRVAYHTSSGAYRILGLPDTTGDVIAHGSVDGTRRHAALLRTADQPHDLCRPVRRTQHDVRHRRRQYDVPLARPSRQHGCRQERHGRIGRRQSFGRGHAGCWARQSDPGGQYQCQRQHGRFAVCFDDECCNGRAQFRVACRRWSDFGRTR